MSTTAIFGIIVSTRGFFPASFAVQGRRQVIDALDRLGFGHVIVPETAVPNGAIETYRDAKKCAAFFQEHRQAIDGIIVVLPNFGDEQGVVQAIDMADLHVPVLVQACDEDSLDLGLGKRRDAFCGKLSVCNNLYQYGIPFTNTSGHTCRLDAEEFAADLERFAAVCRVVGGLRRARIGAIGARPEAFHTVRFSEKLLQACGITVVTVDLSDIVAAAHRLPSDDARVTARIAAIRAYGSIPAATPHAALLAQARLCVAIDDWMEANECDASAIQCWTSVQENYGCASCLAMSMMGERGRPSACEMDIAGAVSMLALRLAAPTPPGFLDWNNNYGDERDRCIITHCSNFPRSFMGSGIEISTLDVLGESLGRDRCFGGIKGRIAAGPCTFARISTDDVRGTIKAYVGEGAFTDDPFTCDGGVGVCRVPRLPELLDYLCLNGFEHHVAMSRSSCARALAEAFGTYLGWDVYRHE